MSSASIGSVLWDNAEKLGGRDAAIKVIDEGMAAWKAERLVEFWEGFDGGIQRVTAEAIKQWPEGASFDGIKPVLTVAKAVLAEMAATYGLPDDFLPFTPAAPQPGEQEERSNG